MPRRCPGGADDGALRLRFDALVVDAPSTAHAEGLADLLECGRGSGVRDVSVDVAEDAPLGTRQVIDSVLCRTADLNAVPIRAAGGGRLLPGFPPEAALRAAARSAAGTGSRAEAPLAPTARGA
jgi:hypothetical protein